MKKAIKAILIGIAIAGGIAFCDGQEISKKQHGNRVESYFKTSKSDYVLIVEQSNIKINWSPSTAGARIAADQPVANAGDDVTACVDSIVTLSSAGSYDPQGLALQRSWYWVSKPAESEAALAGAGNESCSFEADVLGKYTVGLKVWAPDNRSDSDTVAVTVEDCDYAPKAVIRGPGEICMEMPATFKLDGSDSHTKEGSISKYTWAIISAPTSNIQTIDNEHEYLVQVDTPGRYQFSLIVENSLGLESKPVYYSVKVSDGEPPTINGTGKRKTFKSLLMERDIAVLNITIQYRSDCRKSPEKYIYAKRALEEAEFGPATNISNDAIDSNENTRTSRVTIEDNYLKTGHSYIYLIAGLNGNGEVITYQEIQI